MLKKNTEGNREEAVLRYIEVERKLHPWMDDAMLRHVVEDTLKHDPEFYEKEMLEGWPDKHEDMHEKKGKEEDKEEEEEEE